MLQATGKDIDVYRDGVYDILSEGKDNGIN